MDTKKGTKKKLNKADRRIWCSIEKTIQLKQFEPVKIIAGISINISDDSDIDLEYDDLWGVLENQVESTLDNME